MTALQVRSRPGTGHPARPGRGGHAVARPAAFWLLALVLAVTMLGTALCLFSIGRIAPVRGAR